jgi:hypothetical protein
MPLWDISGTGVLTGSAVVSIEIAGGSVVNLKINNTIFFTTQFGMRTYTKNYKVYIISFTPNSGPQTTAGPITTAGTTTEFEMNPQALGPTNRDYRIRPRIDGFETGTTTLTGATFTFISCDEAYITADNSGLPNNNNCLNLALQNASLSDNFNSLEFFFQWLNAYAKYLVDLSPEPTITFSNITLSSTFNIPTTAVITLANKAVYTIATFMGAYAAGSDYLMLPLLQSASINPSAPNPFTGNADFITITDANDSGNLPVYLYHDSFGSFVAIDQAPYQYPQVPFTRFVWSNSNLNWWFIRTNGFPIISRVAPVVPCLLKGTQVLTPDGYKSIETLSTSDIILNHDKNPMPIKKISNRKIRWEENLSDDKRIFKIEGPEPIYLTGYHKVRLDDGTFQEAHNCYLPFAKKEEYVDKNGDFEIYHIHVDDWSNNHLIVNGGKVVESWSGEYSDL